VSAPYRPVNYQSSHFSPSPKRMNPLNSPPLRNTRVSNLNINQQQMSNAQNLNYEDQDSNGFSLQLNQTQPDAPGFMYPFQRSYSHSMKYNDPSRIQQPFHQYPQNVMQPPVQHFTQHQNINENPFKNQQTYVDYGRDSYSPDANRRSYIEQPEFKGYGNTNQRFMEESWHGYPPNQFPAQMYPSQIQQRASIPEEKMNIKTNSSRSSTIDIKSTSQGEDLEVKSSSNYEEIANGYDINSPELIEKACEFAKDQAGCRLLQKKIMEGSPEIIIEIYDKIQSKFVELMNNPFGNYLCQKITESVDKEYLIGIIEAIRKDVVDICCNSHGTRAVQKIIECANDRELKDLIINLIKEHVQTLVEDINGNHVIQKILFTFKAPDNEFIYEAMINKCKEIACHKHGC